MKIGEYIEQKITVRRWWVVGGAIDFYLAGTTNDWIGRVVGIGCGIYMLSAGGKS